MTKLKMLLLVIAVAGQLTGTIMLFYSVKVALMVFVVYIFAIIIILLLLIRERRNEKREDEEHDYRDY